MQTFDNLAELLRCTTDECAQRDIVRQLGELGDPRAVPLLVAVLESTTSWRVRDATALALGALGDNSVIPALMKQILDPQNANNNGTLLAAFRDGLDGRSVVVDLARILCTGGYEVMVKVLMAIEAFPGPLRARDKEEAIAIIEHCLQEHTLVEPWQQEFLAEALDTLDDIDAV